MKHPRHRQEGQLARLSPLKVIVARGLDTDITWIKDIVASTARNAVMPVAAANVART